MTATEVMTTTIETGTNRQELTTPTIGANILRPDAVDKTEGRFAFSSDLWAESMLWGKILRSPHPHARIVSIDTTKALNMPGVKAVLTWDDIPGNHFFGLEKKDQPVFAHDVVRYVGEPIAAVAATHPEIARQAAEAIEVSYDPLPAFLDPEEIAPADPTVDSTRRSRRDSEQDIFRHISIRHGNLDVQGEVQVEGSYEVGMQDQAFMGPESGLAIPASDGGVDLYISTQWLHVDRDQIAACLALPPELVRLHLAGVGGAFGAREDITLQIHLCLLALSSGQPVKIVFNRQESFLGHVHRHPARMWYRHHALKDGTLVKVEARIILDGGAYASSSPAVIANAACFAAGPYRVPSAAIDGFAVRTNNPPCGAMRGFGAVQACFGYETQMDKLASALDMDPIELRLKNALRTGDTFVTGQVLQGSIPVAEVIKEAASAPLPPHLLDNPLAMPGGAGRCSDTTKLRRGIGFAVGFKNLLYSEGFDDYSTAKCRLDGDTITVICAAVEVGQGFITLAHQIARDVFDTDKIVFSAGDTNEVGSAGSTSASRQTWMSGGAVQAACNRLRDRLLTMAAEELEVSPHQLYIKNGRIISSGTSVEIPFEALSVNGPIEEFVEYHHEPTYLLDDNGQGDAHVSFAFAAHKAIVDVDPELGLVRVTHISTAQDVGKVLNPIQLIGQIEGGTMQGVGLATMEELIVENGVVKNPSFTDYLIPTALDAPDIYIASLIEQPEPGAPFGAKGVGEPPAISSVPAVVSAIRQATGAPLTRVPVRPQDIVFSADNKRPTADGVLK